MDGEKRNENGGMDFVEVDHLGQRGRPSAVYRVKLAAEIKALRSTDRIIIVDSKDPSRRITYTAEDIPNADTIVETRTTTPAPRAPGVKKSSPPSTPTSEAAAPPAPSNKPDPSE